MYAGSPRLPALLERSTCLEPTRLASDTGHVLSSGIRSLRRVNFQDMIGTLNAYWGERGAVIMQPYHTELGAGTANPATFLRCLGPKPWQAAYVEPVIRPTDGRYGENPYRFQHYFQYQVILKPAPEDVLDLYFGTGSSRRSAPGASAGRSGATRWR